MNSENQNIEQLLCTDIGYYQRTQFESVQLTDSNVNGKPIGIGKCEAVVLYLNRHLLNNVDGDLNACLYIYYGDRSRQYRELEAGQMSDIIFCNDLNEVYIRCPFDPNETDVEAMLQVTIYHKADKPDSHDR